MISNKLKPELRSLLNTSGRGRPHSPEVLPSYRNRNIPVIHFCEFTKTGYF